MMSLRLVRFLALVCLAVAWAVTSLPVASAAQPQPAPSGAGPTAGASGAPPPTPVAAGQGSEPVLAATAVVRKGSEEAVARLYRAETIVVTVRNLKEWVARPGNDVSALVLYLDGRAVKGLPVRPQNIEKNLLEFDLERNTKTNPTWKVLLARPEGVSRTFIVGIGGEKAPPSNAEGPKLTIVIISWTWFWIFVALLAAALVSFLWAAANTNLLRDTTTQPDAGGRLPFSLGRVQMSVWFFLVGGTYVLIWMVTSDYDNLTESALWLVGISAATALGSFAVDAAKPNQRGAATTVPNTASPTVRFFRELLGTDGAELHRLQMLVWTCILGVIFIVTVWQELAMPTFGTNVLALMGISSGAYVGFKFPERR